MSMKTIMSGYMFEDMTNRNETRRSATVKRWAKRTYNRYLRKQNNNLIQEQLDEAVEFVAPRKSYISAEWTELLVRAFGVPLE